ncbi:MAG TPA: c-type cytochrome [Geobacteraceae bacterium]|nr:c-type cytochrome [Geobacteraceae bacterium]
MGKLVMFGGLAAGLCLLFPAGCSPQSGESAREIFVQHCAGCHPDGDNTVNPQKTLHRKDLEANNIKTPGDIVNRMRNPGVGMPRFNRNVITDKDAEKVGQYILSTFK